MKKRQEKHKNKKKIQKSLNSDSHNNRKRHNLYIFLILILTAIVFSNTINNDFVNWDDGKYIHENTYIKDLSIDGIKKIFSKECIILGNYHPLTILTYAIEYHFFGLNPKVFHFTNYLLHIINTLLVFIFIRLISNRIEIPLITALLFAIHPMHVESVAWISERKDVLYTLFFLSSLILWVKYIKTGYKKHLLLILTFVLFLFSLLSKPAAVVLPPVMLLCVYFINRKIKINDIIICVPFFVLSLVFGIITMKTQVDAIGDLSYVYNNFNKIFIISYTVYFYIIRFIFPYNFSTLHSFPEAVNNILPAEYYIAPLLIILIAVLFFLSKKEFKHILIFGLVFFMINIALVTQIITVGQAVVSERYTYVPYIGLGFIVAYIFTKLKNNHKIKLYAFSFTYLLFLIISTWNQNKVWADSITLWTKALEVNPRIPVAYSNRGIAKKELGDYIAAIKDYDKAIEINPKYFGAFNNRGNAKRDAGDNIGAIQDFNIAIEIKPDYAEAFNNRGLAKHNIGNYKEAIDDYNKAIEIDNKHAKLFYNRAVTKSALNDFSGAVEDYNIAIKMKPDYSEAYNNRGLAKSNLNDFSGALDDYNKAIELNPQNARAYNNRGLLIAKSQEKYYEAINDFNKAIEINNKFATAYANRGNAKYFLGNIQEACIDWKIAAELGNSGVIDAISEYCK